MMDAWDAEDGAAQHAEDLEGQHDAERPEPDEEHSMVQYGVPPFTDPILRSTAEYALVFKNSGFFKDTRQLSQALAKILAGRELGVPPIAALTEIHIVEGKVTLSGQLLAALVKRSGRYDYRVTESTDEKCVVAFLQRTDEGWTEIGQTSFTMADAARAGLADKSNWKRYPRAMLRARALSEGIRTHTPDVTSGASVYVEGELTDDRDPVTVDAETGEIVEAR